MLKIINYFFQSLIIYFFYIIGFILGIKLSRKIFSSFFSLIGPLFKSKKIIERNLEIYSDQISDDDKKFITNNMWRNYGMTFIEYIFKKIA